MLVVIITLYLILRKQMLFFYSSYTVREIFLFHCPLSAAKQVAKR